VNVRSTWLLRVSLVPHHLWWPAGPHVWDGTRRDRVAGTSISKPTLDLTRRLRGCTDNASCAIAALGRCVYLSLVASSAAGATRPAHGLHPRRPADGEHVGVEPPMFVELEVVETDPGFKGDTVQGGTKQATLETGAQINVPLFITTGEKVKVDTRTGDYMGRA